MGLSGGRVPTPGVQCLVRDWEGCVDTEVLRPGDDSRIAKIGFLLRQVVVTWAWSADCAGTHNPHFRGGAWTSTRRFLILSSLVERIVVERIEEVFYNLTGVVWGHSRRARLTKLAPPGLQSPVFRLSTE